MRAADEQERERGDGPRQGLLALRRLRGRPQLEIFVADRGVERVGERARECSGANDFQDVGEILEPMGGAQAGGQFEFDELLDREQRDACPAHRQRGGIGPTLSEALRPLPS